MRCDGDKLVSCYWSHEFPIDCTVFQGRCAGTGASSHCEPIAAECTPGVNGQCVGNSIRLCVNGRYRSIDCTTIGFRTCEEAPAMPWDMGGAAGHTWCIP